MTTATARLAVGTPVSGKTFGGGAKLIEGTVKAYEESNRGAWVIVAATDGKDYKTRPSMVTAK